MARYTTLIFDLGDVLFAWSAKTRTSISPTTLHAILASSTWCLYERALISEDTCYTLTAAEFSIPSTEIREAFIHARESLVADHALVDFIKTVKAVHTLNVFAMSNISLPDWDVLQTKDADWSIFDHVFTSGAAGERKPDAAFFHHVIKETGIDPQATIFVDDKAENVQTAKELGFRGIVFDDVERVKEEISKLLGEDC
ncbi:HAD-like protein [Crucibulum laeve]|uniref:HAD-like protein n=1 Tax=Crucibulum laeve TaxID=68775 RepID=A0A5C3LVA2_9AGAR|nr:HAD-like protein [Crucibulum laeve]